MPFDLQCKREWEYLKSLTLQLKRKRYAIARIIEKTQTLQAMFWFNLNSFPRADLKHARWGYPIKLMISSLQLPSVCP